MAKRPTKPATSRTRNIVIGVGAFVIGSASLAAVAVFGERLARGAKVDGTADETDADASPSAAPAASVAPAPSAEHVPTDLLPSGDPGAGGRAPDAFRPDPTAPVPPELRESLRPATGPAPSLSGGESVVSTLARD